ncbi:uncharacterized protein LOC141907305 isoform X2 [Tubulanus polymorphus]|uniref:uncharacterized protein LOC141907305 isoform X2 n=1 Tax=Tubulanus polymorphus TaxID=672921 RepID=UPI003DA50EAE
MTWLPKGFLMIRNTIKLHLASYLVFSDSSGRFPVGQNLAKGHSSWKSAITDWFNEYKNFKYNKKRTGVIGHFTQVVWASTNRVGCGFSLCPIGRIWACNYAPAGNYAHMLLKPYPSGASQGVDCPKSLKHGVCDCGSSICIAGGTLNANTCKCKCPYNKPWIRPPECGVNCTLVTDKLSWICKTNNGPWGPKYCKYGNVKNEHCPVMCGICPGSDISRQVEGGAIVYDLQTPTTPAPTASTINPAPTTTPVAPTTPVPTKHPHQSDCSKPDDKICGLPSRKGSYHRKSCYKRKVYTRCPAMCRRCQARSCVDAHSKIRKIGETWIHINEFKVRCTKHGYHFIRGCRVSMGQKVIILFPGKTYGRCRCRKRPRGLVQWKCYRRLF